MLPLLCAAMALKAPAGKSKFSYGTLTNPTIVNNGHGLQVTLPANFVSDVQIPIAGKWLPLKIFELLCPAHSKNSSV